MIELGFSRLAAGVVLLAVLAACESVPDADERARQDRVANAEQFARLARATAEGGDIPAAANLYGRAVRADQSNPVFKRAYGRTLIALGRYQEAIVQFQAALDIDAKDVDALTGLGVALDLTGDHKTAQQRYIDGLEIHPERRALNNNLAFSLALNGEFEEAIEILEDVVGDVSATSRNRLNLALVYGLAGRMAEAREAARGLLNAQQIESNISYYSRLRTLPPEARRKAVLGGTRAP